MIEDTKYCDDFFKVLLGTTRLQLLNCSDYEKFTPTDSKTRPPNLKSILKVIFLKLSENVHLNTRPPIQEQINEVTIDY